MDYKLSIGLWKSFKNTLVVLIPALGASWAAFSANVPVEYQPYIAFLGGFIAYMAKNFYQVKSE